MYMYFCEYTLLYIETNTIMLVNYIKLKKKKFKSIIHIQNRSLYVAIYIRILNIALHIL